jgi:PadR family transcriptional regulator, regulatory protein PadR
MAKQEQQRTNLLHGSRDMVVLRTLLYGPAHGSRISKHIQRTRNEFLRMQHESLYPALQGWHGEAGQLEIGGGIGPQRGVRVIRTEKCKKRLVVRSCGRNRCLKK